MKRLTYVLPLLLVGLFFVGCMSEKSPATVKSSAYSGMLKGPAQGDEAEDMTGKKFLGAADYESFSISMQGLDAQNNPLWDKTFHTLYDVLFGVITGDESQIKYFEVSYTDKNYTYYGKPYCMVLYEVNSGKRLQVNCDDILDESADKEMMHVVPPFNEDLSIIAYMGANTIADSQSFLYLPPIFTHPLK